MQRSVNISDLLKLHWLAKTLEKYLNTNWFFKEFHIKKENEHEIVTSLY